MPKPQLTLAAAVITLLIAGCADSSAPTAPGHTPPPTQTNPQALEEAEKKSQSGVKPEHFAKRSLMAQDAAVNLSIAGKLASLRPAIEPPDRENYAHFKDNPVRLVAEHPVSTFSIDVDTGSYSNVRRMLNAGRMPAQDAVRVEELLNYFDYDYPPPETTKTPFRVTTEIGPNPWNEKTACCRSESRDTRSRNRGSRPRIWSS